jgi:hypothetical protein
MARSRSSSVVENPCFAEIILHDSNGKETGRAKIDHGDVNLVKKHGWHLDYRGYVVAGIKGKPVFLHRLIMNFPKSPDVIDHLNRDKLDNRRSNLRVCSIKANAKNRGTIMVKMTARELDLYLLHGYLRPKNLEIIAPSQARR